MLLQVWAECGAADVSRVCVVMDVPYGRERAGEAAWAGRDSAGWAAEVACRFSCGKHLPHCYSSSALPGSALVWVT